MAKTRTLVQLRTEVRQAAGKENSKHVTDAEIDREINRAIAAWWDKLLDYNQDHWIRAAIEISVAAGDTGKSLATNTTAIQGAVLDVLAVEVEFGDKVYKICPLDDWEMRHELLNRTTGWQEGGEIYYLLGRDCDLELALEWYPQPTANHCVVVHFLHGAPELTLDSDVLNGINGWEEWVVWQAASYCLNKEESNWAYAIQRRNEVEQRMAKAGPTRDKNKARRVRDVRGRRRRGERGLMDVWGDRR